MTTLSAPNRLGQVLPLLTCDVAYIISLDPRSPPPISPPKPSFRPSSPYTVIYRITTIPHTIYRLAYDHSEWAKQVISLLTCDVTYILSLDPRSPPPISPLNRPFCLPFPLNGLPQFHILYIDSLMTTPTCSNMTYHYLHVI